MSIRVASIEIQCAIAQTERSYKDRYWFIRVDDDMILDYRGYTSLQDLLDDSDEMFFIYEFLEEGTTVEEWTHDYYIDKTYPRAMMEFYSREYTVFDSEETCRALYAYVRSQLPPQEYINGKRDG